MSLLLLLGTTAASGSTDGDRQLDADGNVLLDADGNILLGCCCTLVAPIRECSDGAQFTIPEDGLPAYNVCLPDDVTIYYWWSNSYWACFYWDCAEKAAGEERGILLSQELDPD